MIIVVYTIVKRYIAAMFENCLYFNSNALARTVSRIWTEAYRPFDLSPPHAFLLRLVLARPGLMPRELANELSLSRSTVTRFLDSLEARGLLRRKATSEDGREVQVYPTRAALVIQAPLDQTGQNLSKEMARIIGQDDLRQVVGRLRNLQARLERE